MGTIKEILLEFFVALLCAGSIAGLLMGVAMLVRPEQLVRINQYFSQWVGAEKITEQLDRPRWSERFLYRHHRLVGGVLFVGAIFIFYTFMISYNVRRLAATVASGYWGLMDALVGMLLVGSVLAALIGIVVMAKPSLLREIEKSSNRWISTEGMTKFFNRMSYSADRSILRRRKIAGVLLIVSSLYILIVLGNFLWRGGLKL